MSKKSANQKQALRKQQEQAALNNIFNVFLVGLAAECVLFLIYQFYCNGTINSFLMWDSILRVVAWLGLGAFVGGAGVALWKKQNPKLQKVGLLAGSAGLYLSVVSWVSVKFFDTGITGLCVAVPVATVLGLIYFLYQRECFVNTALIAGSLFTIWVCNKGMSGYWATMVTFCAGAVILGLLAVAVLSAKIKKNDGELAGHRVFSMDCNYAVIYGVCAVCALVILAVLVMPSLYLYMTWALVIALFAELAYYTTKMM